MVFDYSFNKPLNFDDIFFLYKNFQNQQIEYSQNRLPWWSLGIFFSLWWWSTSWCAFSGTSRPCGVQPGLQNILWRNRNHAIRELLQRHRQMMHIKKYICFQGKRARPCMVPKDQSETLFVLLCMCMLYTKFWIYIYISSYLTVWANTTTFEQMPEPVRCIWTRTALGRRKLQSLLRLKFANTAKIAERLCDIDIAGELCA